MKNTIDVFKNSPTTYIVSFSTVHENELLLAAAMLLTFYIADNVLYGIKIALQLIDAGAQIKAGLEYRPGQNSLERNRRLGFYSDKYGNYDKT